MKLSRLEKLARHWLEFPENVKKRQNVIAIIYDKQGKVFAVGENTYVKTCPVQSSLALRVGCESKVFLHAEICALARFARYANFKPDGIFVARLSKSGELVNATPCEICQLAIQEAGIKKVRHT